MARVVDRVRQGGHHVPEPDIRRRFASGILNLFSLYRPLADACWLYDASELPPRLIATETDGQLDLIDAGLHRKIEQSSKEPE
ncbi:MAG TPA: hypothetical protein VHV55_08895 [Pirellulales bacterium]|nr:hypothetical protein [Pirellulales bacterium]